MPRTLLTPEQILSILAATPARLAELTIDLTEARLHAAPAPGEWSANDVLAHLRSFRQDKPTIRAVNPRTWIRSTNYLEQKFRPSLQAFTAQRTELLAGLGSSKPRTWLRTATVTGAGKPLELSVLSYADRLAVHERTHLKQIERIVSLLQK